jgi:hypothetical protein
VRLRGDVVDLLEALEFELFDVRNASADKHLARNAPFVSG